MVYADSSNGQLNWHVHKVPEDSGREGEGDRLTLFHHLAWIQVVGADGEWLNDPSRHAV